MSGRQARRAIGVLLLAVPLPAGPNHLRVSAGSAAGLPQTHVVAAPGPVEISGVQSIFNDMNAGGVSNGPTSPATFGVAQPFVITLIMDYHWNNGRGQPGGTIALQSAAGRLYGPWKVGTSSGQGGAPNVNWTVHPYAVIPPGTYTIVDSSPSTWSTNAQSGGRGFSTVQGAPATEPATKPHAGATPTPGRPATQPTAVATQHLTFSPSVAKSVAASSAALLRIAGYLASGHLQAFVDSLSHADRTLLGHSVRMAPTVAAAVGTAMKHARVTSAALDVVYYGIDLQGTAYTLSMVKESGAWKLDQF